MEWIKLNVDQFLSKAKERATNKCITSMQISRALSLYILYHLVRLLYAIEFKSFFVALEKVGLVSSAKIKKLFSRIVSSVVYIFSMAAINSCFISRSSIGATMPTLSTYHFRLSASIVVWRLVFNLFDLFSINFWSSLNNSKRDPFDWWWIWSLWSCCQLTHISPRLGEFKTAYLIINTIGDVEENVYHFNPPIII